MKTAGEFSESTKPRQAQAKPETADERPKGETLSGNEFDEYLVALIVRNLSESALSPCLESGGNRGLFCDGLAVVIRRALLIIRDEDGKRRALKRDEGVAAARERGVLFGRRAKPLPKNFESAFNLWKKGDLNTSEAARVCGMSRSTFRYQAQCRIAAGDA